MKINLKILCLFLLGVIGFSYVNAAKVDVKNKTRDKLEIKITHYQFNDKGRIEDKTFPVESNQDGHWDCWDRVVSSIQIRNFKGKQIGLATMNEWDKDGARWFNIIINSEQDIKLTKGAGLIEREKNVDIHTPTDAYRAKHGDKNLVNADLSNEDLTGANLTGANLRNANLTGLILDF